MKHTCLPGLLSVASVACATAFAKVLLHLTNISVSVFFFCFVFFAFICFCFCLCNRALPRPNRTTSSSFQLLITYAPNSPTYSPAPRISNPISPALVFPTTIMKQNCPCHREHDYIPNFQGYEYQCVVTRR